MVREVINFVEDLPSLLASVGGQFPLRSRAGGAFHPATRNPLDGTGAEPKERAVRDIYVPDL